MQGEGVNARRGVECREREITQGAGLNSVRASKRSEREPTQ